MYRMRLASTSEIRLLINIGMILETMCPQGHNLRVAIEELKGGWQTARSLTCEICTGEESPGIGDS